MLGKVIKYEIKNSYKSMLLMFGVFAMFTIFACISAVQLGNAEINDVDPKALPIIIFVLYVFAAIALYIVTLIFQCLRFHKTMYSEQGYLTHTLPASTFSIFNTKLITSVVWVLCALVVIGVSILCIFTTLVSAFDEFTFKEVAEAIGDTINSLCRVGINPASFFIVIGAYSILGLFEFFLWIYTSMAVGQLSSQNRTMISFAAAIGFYIVNQTVSSSIFGLQNLSKYSMLLVYYTSDVLLFKFYTSMVIYLLVVDAALYALSLFINTKKLNLQ